MLTILKHILFKVQRSADMPCTLLAHLAVIMFTRNRNMKVIINSFRKLQIQSGGGSSSSSSSHDKDRVLSTAYCPRKVPSMFLECHALV